MKMIAKILLFFSLNFILFATDIESVKNYLDKNETNLAIASLEQILMFNEKDDKANFYMGKIFVEKGNIKLAKLYFRKIVNPDKEMKLYLDNFYKLYPDNHLSFKFYFKVGVKFDSNINNDSSESGWTIIDENGDKKDIQHDSDKTLGVAVYELFSFIPIYDIEIGDIVNKFTIYNRNIIMNSDLDVQIFEYSPSFRQKYNNIDLQHFLIYDYIRYGNDEYMNSFKIGENIEFDFFETFNNYTTFFIGYNKSLLSNSKSDNYYEAVFKTAVTKHLLDNRVNVKVGAGGADTFTQKSDTNAISYYRFNYNVGVDFLVLNRKIDLRTDVTFTNYKKGNNYFDKKEKDREYHYIIAMDSKKSYGFISRTKLEYVNHISNLEPYKYKKFLVSIEFIKKFKGF